MKLKGRIQQLGTQLILFYMAISLIVLSAASIFIYSFMLGMIKENNETLLLQQFQQLDHNITGLFEDADSLTKFFLLEPSVQRFLQYAPEKGEIEFLEMKKDLHASIESYVTNYDFIDSIYLVGEDQGMVGGTPSTTLVHSDSAWLEQFIASPLFRHAHRAFPQMVAEGGLRKSDYNPYRLDTDNGSVISLARGVRQRYESETNAILIMNVDERYLSSIYSTALQADDGKMYIVDAQGDVMTSSQAADIGKTSRYQPFADGTGDYGSYDDTRADTRIQVMYYKLNKANWYMIKEIPLGPFSAQIYAVQTLLIIVLLISLITVFIISYFWLKRTTRPLHILAHKMKDMSRGELGATFAKIPNNEFGLVIRRFNEMSLSIVELLHKTNEMQEQRRELEIEALRNQINPHFLYNTLNMIRWMAASIRADNIVTSVVALGNILRPTFTNKDPMCALRDELHYLENYIKIINLRFSDSVICTIDVREAYLDRQVPRFILQPLIENAITFGRGEEEQEIQIRIQVQEEEADLIIVVTDSGIGIEPARLAMLNERMQAGERYADLPGGGNGIGLYNVNRRIQLNFGSPYGVRLIQQAAGTRVKIRLPNER